MIFIFWIVFFIICDEKWYKIWFENNQIVFDKAEKNTNPMKSETSRPMVNLNAVYKNSDLIHLNYEFEAPKEMRKSDWIDSTYLARLKKEKWLEKERLKNQEKIYTWPSFLSLDDSDSISSIFEWLEGQDNTWISKNKIKQNTWTNDNDEKYNTWIDKNFKSNTWETAKKEVEKEITYYPVKEYEYSINTLDLKMWAEIPLVHIKRYPVKRNLTINLENGKEIEPLYKNSSAIKLYSGFEDPLNLRNSAGIDEEYLAKMKNNKPTIVSLDDDTISSTIENSGKNPEENTVFISDDNSVSIWEKEEKVTLDLDKNNNTGVIILSNHTQTVEENEIQTWNFVKIDESKQENTYEIEKYEPDNHSINMNMWRVPEEETIAIEEPEIWTSSVNLSEWKMPKVSLIKIDKYQPTKNVINLKKGREKITNVLVENSKDAESEGQGLSDPIFEKLLENEEIDIDTLESENDEFLQKVFEKTKDKEVMNLIVETYLNEYQFVKAKKFIESLPEAYRNQLDPSLNLRVAFNSFSLSSATTNENLTTLVQEYSAENRISEEDKNRYIWVIALMSRNYDNFFAISSWFTSEKNQTFSLKLQWYKNQIAKQMWMPDYYFDTLVSLELFNQWLFQPAKVLALYSLQKNANYILPYQVLAYANFLTNSRDSSIEYLKKLMELDPNNVEKYRFLVWVASYRDEKYEQSVVMLSRIQDDKLRLDAQRYLINDYIKLDQRTKLIVSRNKLLWYENLVASDFYTYFYEAFYHPYSEWKQFQIYAFDIELANKMLRVCSMTLSNEERAVCTYWTIGRNIALWQFDWIEQYLLNLVAEYPQWYLYQALWDYYVQQWDLEKAKAYLLKAVSLTKKRSEINQIKKLLQDTI